MQATDITTRHLFYQIKTALDKFKRHAVFFGQDINDDQLNAFTIELNRGIAAMEAPRYTPVRPDKVELLRTFYSSLKTLNCVKKAWVEPKNVRETRRGRDRFMADYGRLTEALTVLVFDHNVAEDTAEEWLEGGDGMEG
jgi:hypothetical protein